MRITQCVDVESSSQSRANAASHSNQSCLDGEDSTGLAFPTDVEQSTHNSDDGSEAQSTHGSDNESEVHRISQLHASSELLSHLQYPSLFMYMC